MTAPCGGGLCGVDENGLWSRLEGGTWVLWCEMMGEGQRVTGN